MSLVITGVFEEILVHYRAPYHGENLVDTMYTRITKQFYQHRRTDHSLLALCARMMGDTQSLERLGIPSHVDHGANQHQTTVDITFATVRTQ